MKKILLITLGLSIFISADLNTPYTIQDEISEQSTAIDSELLPIEKISTTPKENVLLDMKHQYSIEDESAEKPRKLENETVPVKNNPKIKDVKKVTKDELEIEKIRRELNIQSPKLSAKEIKVKKVREE